MRKLRSFHARAVRYMTGSHIRKVREEWEYPYHKKFLKICGLLPIEVYLERRRGSLRNYLEKWRPDLLEEAERCENHCLDVHKILWWKQKCLSKNELKNKKRFLVQ